VSGRELAFLLFSSAASIAALVVVPRALRDMKAESDDEWRRAWKHLEPGRRKAIRAKMARGEAIEDPDDAELALRAAAQVERVRQALRPVKWIFGGLLFALVVTVALTGPRLLAVLIGAGLASSASLSAFAWHRRRRLLQSVEATRRVGIDRSGRTGIGRGGRAS
jgi:hypothetical protein